MSIKNIEQRFSFEHRGRTERLTGIRELGFNTRGAFVIDAWTTPIVAEGEPRGSYLTTIPISSINYRAKVETDAAYFRTLNSITIFSDAGLPYVIRAPSDIISTLALECIANDIPRRNAK